MAIIKIKKIAIIFVLIIATPSVAAQNTETKTLYCPFADSVVVLEGWTGSKVDITFSYQSGGGATATVNNFSSDEIFVSEFSHRSGHYSYRFQVMEFEKIGWRLWNKRINLNSGKEFTQSGWCFCSIQGERCKLPS